MILELALIGTAVAGAVGALVARRRKKATRPAGPPRSERARPLPSVGDVLSAGGEERYLTGCVRGREGRGVALEVFLATDERGRAVATTPERAELLWLETIEAPAGIEGLPPTVEVAHAPYRCSLRRHVRFTVEGAFERRIPGRVDSFDEGEGVVVVYDSGVRDVVVVVKPPAGDLWVWKGYTVRRSEVERWGKGSG